MNEDFKKRFLIDENLLGLVRRLRMMGLDSMTAPGSTDEDLIALARVTQRTILTKDKGLFEGCTSVPCYLVQSSRPQEQLSEVLNALSLREDIDPFTRCFLCNSLIEEVAKEQLQGRVDDKTLRIFEKFYLCPICQKIYWEGSHYESMRAKVDAIQAELSAKNSQDR
nr:hypothetical protein HAGR004_26570 [Bdellovibrio sp. HAGR004]